jgi:hypothetical protein
VNPFTNDLGRAPPTSAAAGTSRVTTAPAAATAPSPIVDAFEDDCIDTNPYSVPDVYRSGSFTTVDAMIVAVADDHTLGDRHIVADSYRAVAIDRDVHVDVATTQDRPHSLIDRDREASEEVKGPRSSSVASSNTLMSDGK